ncbi:molecular chaperone TorD family protein [Candidatus Binatia bacterium]|nr:molecular chaperone TorD family protein [Candidatus Binatia bacterium]
MTEAGTDTTGASPPTQRAGARSRAYLLVVRAFDYPDREFVEVVRGGLMARAMQDALVGIHPEMASADWSGLADAGAGDDDLAVEYTRLFDVGAGGPPCPLCGGLYGSARMKTMEECVRFYNHFGLTLAESPRELPDHLATQLEFLHFLAHREAEASGQGADPGPWRRAARDFIERHPGKWVPQLRARLIKQKPMRFFQTLVEQTERFLGYELIELGR